MVKLNNQIRKTMLREFTLVFIACAIAVTSFAGGPWTQKKGQGYFKLSEWWVVFDEHFTDVGLKDPNITTGIYNTSFYGEYGFTDRFTTTLYAPIFSRNYMNNLVSATTGDVLVKGEAVNFMGDVDLAFKYGLTKPGSKIPVAVSVLFGVPTGKSSAGELNNLQTGDGEFNQMLQFDAGKGFNWSKKVGGYASVYLGINHRTQGFSEELRFGLETGAGLFNQKLWVTAKLFGIESFKNGATAEDITSTSIFANNTEYISYSFEASYYLKKRVGVSAGYASLLRGEIIAAAPSYTVGIFLDLSK